MTTSYYSSLSAAITVVNGGTAETVAAENAKAAIITSPGQLTKVKLLADVSESAEITVNEDIDLVLNGYTLRFTEIGGYLHFNTGTNSVIHGAGGAIVKNLDTAASDNAMLVSSDGNSLQIRGGSYTVSADTTGTVLAIRASGTCDLLEMEDCSVEVSNATGMAVGAQTQAGNSLVTRTHCTAKATGRARGFMSTRTIKFTDCHVEGSSVNRDANAIRILSGAVCAESCCFISESQSYYSTSICVEEGNSVIKGCKIRADAYHYWAYGIELIAGTMELAQSSVIATAHKGENADGRGVYVGDKAKLKVYNCSIIADSTPNNVVPGDNTMGIFNNGTTSIENSTVYGNFCGVYNSTAERNNAEDIPPEPGKLYVNGGTYTGFSHGGFYFAHGSDGEAFVNDAIIRGGHYEGIFDYSGVPESTKFAAMYIGGGSDEHNSSMTAYLDGCFFDASDCHRSIVVRGSSGEQNNTLNISNCTVTHGTLGQGTIRIDNQTLKLNIGRGCNSISDMFKNGYILLNEDGTTRQEQADYLEDGVVEYTGELYRKFPV